MLPGIPASCQLGLGAIPLDLPKNHTPDLENVGKIHRCRGTLCNLYTSPARSRRTRWELKGGGESGSLQRQGARYTAEPHHRPAVIEADLRISKGASFALVQMETLLPALPARR